jgi:hypothetical protein
MAIDPSDMYLLLYHQSGELWYYRFADNQWARFKTSSGSIPNQLGVFGPSFNPPGRSSSILLCDVLNTCYLLGGAGYRNDLWAYRMDLNQWAFLKGNISDNAVPNYGTIGVAADSNIPGGRQRHVGFIDVTGNRILVFGGQGYVSQSSLSYLNDVWSFDLLYNKWTCQFRPSNGNYYAIQGQRPGGRAGAGGFMQTSSNKLFIYGGYGYTTSSETRLEDMWYYDISSASWTMVGGSLTSPLARKIPQRKLIFGNFYCMWQMFLLHLSSRGNSQEWRLYSRITLPCPARCMPR